MTLLPNCCLTTDLLDVKRKRIICRGQSFCHMCSANQDWPGHIGTVSLFAHYILQMKCSASLEAHLFSVISTYNSTAQKHPSKASCQERCRITPNACMESRPAGFEAGLFLCLNDPQKFEWGHAIFSSRCSDISLCQNVPAVTQQHLCLVNLQHCWMLGCSL